MKLLVDNSWDSGQVPVSWCLNQDDREKIKNKIQTEASRNHHVTPYIVIDVIPDGKTETRIRQVAKLTQQKAYLTFNVAGKNRVFAGILFAKKGLEDDIMKKGLMAKHGQGLYKNIFYAFDDVIEIGPDEYALKKICSGNISLMEWTYRTVDVPEQWFAKEPPKWLKKYATIYWSAENKDECDMRKRIVFAFTLQTFILIPVLSFFGIAYGLLLFIIAFFLTFIMGFRYTDWQIVWRQFKVPYYLSQNTPRELWKSCKSYSYIPGDDPRKGSGWDVREHDRKQFQSFFIVDSEGYLRPWYIQILRPWLVILSVTLGSLALNKISPITSSWLIYLPMAMMTGLILIYGFMFLLRLIVYFVEKNEDRKQDKEQTKIDMIPVRQKQLQSKIDNLLLCDGSLSDENLPDIPEGERTIYLRFLEIKGRVCKSYQQG